MITDVVFYAIAIPAVLLSGISKGGLSGLGALAVPMMALVISPAQAAGLMLPILCLMDLFGLWAYRKTWSRSQMRVLLPGSLLGIGIGVLAFGHLNDDAVRVLIGLIAVLFSINQWLKPLLQRQLAGGFAAVRRQRIVLVRHGGIHQLRRPCGRAAGADLSAAAAHGKDAAGGDDGGVLRRGELRQADPVFLAGAAQYGERLDIPDAGAAGSDRYLDGRMADQARE